MVGPDKGSHSASFGSMLFTISASFSFGSWLDDWQFYILFNNISVISGQSDNGRVIIKG